MDNMRIWSNWGLHTLLVGVYHHFEELFRFQLKLDILMSYVLTILLLDIATEMCT